MENFFYFLNEKMMLFAYLFFSCLALMLLDYLIGNQLFPSKVQVLKEGDLYIVMKIHRICFIPRKFYAERMASLMERTIDDFTAIRYHAERMYLEDAIKLAKRFSNKESDKYNEDEIVWSSKQKTRKQSEEQIDKLLQELFRTELIEDKLPILEKIQKLKNK